MDYSGYATSYQQTQNSRFPLHETLQISLLQSFSDPQTTILNHHVTGQPYLVKCPAPAPIRNVPQTLDISADHGATSNEPLHQENGPIFTHFEVHWSKPIITQDTV